MVKIRSKVYEELESRHRKILVIKAKNAEAAVLLRKISNALAAGRIRITSFAYSGRERTLEMEWRKRKKK